MADIRKKSPKVALLVLRAQAGDRDALDQLLERYQGELFAYLKKMLHDHADAEDALQMTLLQAAKKLRWLQNPKVFRAWIYRIASRTAYRLIARRRRSREIMDERVQDIPEVHLEPRYDEDLVAMIPEWLDRLTLKCREAVILHYLRGFTTERVAEILDIPLGTARSRISYALATIRRQLPYEREDQS